MKFEYVNVRDRERKWFKFKTQVQVFFCEFCEICETPYFIVHLFWVLLYCQWS